MRPAYAVPNAWRLPSSRPQQRQRGMPMKLYELTDSYRQILDQLSELDEEALEDQRCEALLEGLSEAFDDKVIGVAKVIHSMDADVTAIAGEVERLARLGRVAERV